MKSEILENWLEKWDLSSRNGAVVLSVSESKISEWLSDKNNRKLPKYIEAHIKTFDSLNETRAKIIIKERLKKD